MLCPPSFLGQVILSFFRIFRPRSVSALSRHLCQGSQTSFQADTTTRNFPWISAYQLRNVEVRFVRRGSCLNWSVSPVTFLVLFRYWWKLSSCFTGVCFGDYTSPENKPLARTRVEVILLLTLAEKKRNVMSSFSSSGCFFALSYCSPWIMWINHQHGQIVQSSVLLLF